MTGPYWLSGAFRPFFLLGAVTMAVSVLVWIPVHLAGLELPTAFAPRDWHVHTVLFGGVTAIVAGFALTAVSNWTGRPAVGGRPLLVLVCLWAAGRIAVTGSALIGPNAAMIADMLFPAALVAVFAREVIAARNWRNLRVVAVVAALALVNLSFHIEAKVFGAADYAFRAAISLVLVMVMLIGGRIIPAFTRNWLVARKAAVLPAAFSRLDAVAMTVAGLALAAWTVFPQHAATALMLTLVGILTAVRLSRWCGLAARAEPLLMILHVAFATVPIGFVAVALSIFLPDAVDPAAAVHVWTAGTIGSITLSVMTRASRGHSGRPLTGGLMEAAMITLVLAGAAARMAAPYADGGATHALEAAGLAFAAAYMLFAFGYWRMLLVRPRGP